MLAEELPRIRLRTENLEIDWWATKLPPWIQSGRFNGRIRPVRQQPFHDVFMACSYNYLRIGFADVLLKCVGSCFGNRSIHYACEFIDKDGDVLGVLIKRARSALKRSPVDKWL